MMKVPGRSPGIETGEISGVEGEVVFSVWIIHKTFFGWSPLLYPIQIVHLHLRPQLRRLLRQHSDLLLGHHSYFQLQQLNLPASSRGRSHGHHHQRDLPPHFQI